MSSENAQTAPNEQFYDFDARGNVSQRLSQSGSILSTDVYNAYGKLLSGNPSGDEFGFGGQAGYRTDQETGLCLLGERYYDPSAERFLTRDPLGYAGGMDLYAYCGDNPVGNLDPTGLDCDDGDPSTPCTVGGWIDHWVFNDSVNNLGTTVGEADAGCATLTDELLAGGKVAGYGALLFVPGGEEARGAEVADEVGTDALEDLGRGCNTCLVAGTPVWTTTGEKPIQDIEVGEQVLSRDPATGKDAVKTVTATVQRPADALVTLSLSDPQSGKTETLTCTPEHPLYVTGQGWVEAGALGIGTSIVTRAGPSLTVKNVTWQRDNTGGKTGNKGGKPFTVYNLTVADDHTYFAGDLDGGLWAHNDCHHSIPKFLGGDARQPLINISHQAHVDYHRLLNQLLRGNGMLGGTGGAGNSTLDWASEMTNNPGTQTRAFALVQSAAQTIDRQYGTSIEQHFLQNLGNGRYTRFP